jgi:hypothetical protein
MGGYPSCAGGYVISEGRYQDRHKSPDGLSKLCVMKAYSL